ncbi:MAG: SAM-dependent methyltransferase [Firmicutes bacterium]|nr:SAM-dependent methyltransferase [Bacillota bacterium]
MCAQVMQLRMKLSERMQVIADHVDAGEVVADIGTDHGQIPVWLFASGISPRAILSDISDGSIRKAEETAAAYQFGEGMSFRTGDGLSVLRPGEADTVIIAGMGGKLIRQILAADPGHTASFRKFILQPRKGQGPLRKWLLQNGYRILCEDVVREGRFLPEIITALSPAFAGSGEAAKHGRAPDLAAADREHLKGLEEQDIRLRVPPWMVFAKGPMEEFFDLRIAQETLILENLQRAKARREDSEQKARDNLDYLRQLKCKYKEI